MIYHVVTLLVKPGKMNEARPLLVDYANHVMKTYPDQEVQILTNVSGPGSTAYPTKHGPIRGTFTTHFVWS